MLTFFNTLAKKNNTSNFCSSARRVLEQAGFVKGKGTREQILNVRQIVEKAKEFDTPVIMCFVDYNKAFDCVNWGCLWRVLHELEVPDHLIALLRTLYDSSQGVVRVDKITSKPFKFHRGVRQGCILSPILFNIYGEYIMRRTCENWEGGITVGGVKMTNLPPPLPLLILSSLLNIYFFGVQ
ncbi:hypothetical protein PYW07_016287 [Mythimna separata]|uniref:Reverse transcriptase domain-containing protein n=1 Tax=Mythimna separata TaxID=271217 RepID=A0AAD7YLD3_MYTSE|nr:hypothetical protein PYW07_016287 [Mythimna separata]